MHDLSSTVFTKNVLNEIANVIEELADDLLSLEEYIIEEEPSRKRASKEIRAVQSVDRMLQEMNDLVRILQALAEQVGKNSGHERALLEAVLSLEKMKSKLIGAGKNESHIRNANSAIFF